MYRTAPLWSDKLYIKVQFKSFLGYWPNLEKPKTFQEKTQWLKLYDRKPIYTQMVDKYEAKSFIEERIGKVYIIPTIGLYDDVSQINYSSLPNSFVMKTTHDSGTVVVCHNKSELDIQKTNEFLAMRLKRDYFYPEREWPYKDVKHRIIIEELIGENCDDLRDYKFFCFNGVPKLMFIVSNRWKEGGHKADFFDMDGNKLDVYQPGFENNPHTPELPSCFEKMKELAAVLSKDIPLLRVDFYAVDDKIYVGELTFSDSGGYVPFIPDKYNRIYGDMITLPTKDE